MNAVAPVAHHLDRLLAFAGRRPLHASVGALLHGKHLTVVRVAAAADAHPQLERLEHVQIENNRRLDAVRRLAASGIFRRARVTVLLTPGGYETQPVPAPAVPETELREALRWQLRGALSFPPEQAALDFVRLPQPDGGRPTLLAIAARLATVDEAVAPFEDAGIEVDAVDVPELALRNLGARHAAAEGTQAWLAFDGDAALFTVQLGAELCFARRLQAPAHVAATDADAQAQFADRVATHVQRSLELFERQSGLPPVLQMTVGPHRQAERIARTLVEATGIDTRVFAWTAEVACDPALLAVSTADALQAALLPLGAALRSAAAGARSSPLAALLARLRKAA